MSGGSLHSSSGITTLSTSPGSCGGSSQASSGKFLPRRSLSTWRISSSTGHPKAAVRKWIKYYKKEGSIWGSLKVWEETLTILSAKINWIRWMKKCKFGGLSSIENFVCFGPRNPRTNPNSVLARNRQCKGKQGGWVIGFLKVHKSN